MVNVELFVVEFPYYLKAWKLTEFMEVNPAHQSVSIFLFLFFNIYIFFMLLICKFTFNYRPWNKEDSWGVFFIPDSTTKNIFHERDRPALWGNVCMIRAFLKAKRFPFLVPGSRRPVMKSSKFFILQNLFTWPSVHTSQLRDLRPTDCHGTPTTLGSNG